MENTYAKELSGKLKGLDFKQGERLLKSINKYIHDGGEPEFEAERDDIILIFRFCSHLNRKDNFFIGENELKRIILKLRLVEPSDEQMENLFRDKLGEDLDLDIENEDLFYLLESGEAWEQYLDCGYQEFFEYFDTEIEWYVILPDGTCYCDGREEDIDIEYEFGIEENTEIETDFKGIRIRIRINAETKPRLTQNGNIKHPVLTEQMQYIDSLNRTVDVLEQKSFELWKNEMIEKIMECDSAKELFSMLRPKERMREFGYLINYLCDKDFSEMLAYVWTTTDIVYNRYANDNNSNNDTLRLWFMDAKKEYLMTDAERQKLQELPEKVAVYRGVQKKELAEGLSWTLNKETATKYATKYKALEENHLYQTEVEKASIMAYFSDNETVIIDPYDLVKQEIIEIAI